MKKQPYNLQIEKSRNKKYIIWNLIYSILLTLMLILLIIFSTVYDNKSTFIQFGNIWFWWFLGIIISSTCAFFCVNIYYSTFRINGACKAHNKPDILIYILGLVFPYIGFVYHQVSIRKLNIQINYDKQIKIKKTAKSITWKIIIYTLIVLGSVILLLPSLLFGTILAQYTPPERFTLSILDDRLENNKTTHNELKVSTGSEIVSYSALTYNTGFNAYNQDMDFFMEMKVDKGKSKSRAQSKNAVYKSQAGIDRILSASHDMITKTNNHDLSIPAEDLRGSTLYKTYYDENKKITNDESESNIQQFNESLSSEGTGTFDFIAFQEQDISSTRSYYVDGYQKLRLDGYSENSADPDPDKNLDDNFANHYSSIFGYNFSVPWVPTPIHEMFGQVLSGLSIYSKYTMEPNAERVALPNISSFPFNLFELKRCLIISRYPVDNGKDFVFINAHFSAYDESGTVRLQQLQFINQIFESEIDKGNYVMIGADWNQILPQTYGYAGSDTKFKNNIIYDENDLAIAPFHFSDFKWNTADPSKSSNDSSFEKYDEFQADKSYNIGDVVSYENENDPTPTYLNTTYVDPSHLKKHLYTPLTDKTTEAPLILNSETNKWEKSLQWRYYNEENYTNTSLSKRILEELLPVAGDQNNKANFFTTRAVPTVRDSGYNFRTTDTNYINQYVTCIDGFLISNNIGVNFTFGFDTEFTYSDHNPVGVSFYFK